MPMPSGPATMRSNLAGPGDAASHEATPDEDDDQEASRVVSSATPSLM